MSTLHDFRTPQVDSVKTILKELEQEGVGDGEAAAIVWLWNQRQDQLKQLREWQVYLTDLQLVDSDTSEGLKVWDTWESSWHQDQFKFCSCCLVLQYDQFEMCNCCLVLQHDQFYVLQLFPCLVKWTLFHKFPIFVYLFSIKPLQNLSWSTIVNLVYAIEMTMKEHFLGDHA